MTESQSDHTPLTRSLSSDWSPFSRFNSGPSWISLVEVGMFFSMIYFAIWWGSRYIRPPVILLGLVMLFLCMISNRWHRDSRERIGLSSQHFMPALRLTAPWLALGIPLVIWGWGKYPLEGWTWPFVLIVYPLWSFAQDYVLLGFVANRLEEGFKSHHQAVPWVSGLLFALVHLPNPILMTGTMLTGTLSTSIFLRKRHLVPLALLHAVLGALLSWASSDINGAMSIGPAYLRRIGTPFGP